MILGGAVVYRCDEPLVFGLQPLRHGPELFQPSVYKLRLGSGVLPRAVSLAILRSAPAPLSLLEISRCRLRTENTIPVPGLGIPRRIIPNQLVTSTCRMTSTILDPQPWWQRKCNQDVCSSSTVWKF